MKKNQISSLKSRLGQLWIFQAWCGIDCKMNGKGFISGKARKAAALTTDAITLLQSGGDWQIMLLTLVVEKQY